MERKALFLSRLSRREEAIESALISLAGFRWNWSAWTLLGSCIGDGEEVVSFPLIIVFRSRFPQLSSLLQLLPFAPDHPLIHFFQIKTLNELHNPSDHELQLCDRLLGHEFFPNSLWIMSLRACVLYHLHGISLLYLFFIPYSGPLQDFGQAGAQFDRILAIDPNRIDDIDVFSNILYVTDSRLKLSRLAHEFLALDKDRPEICCLIGGLLNISAFDMFLYKVHE